MLELRNVCFTRDNKKLVPDPLTKDIIVRVYDLYLKTLTSRPEYIMNKGIELKIIHNEICEYLTQRLISRMKDLEFTLLSQEDKRGRLDYYEKHFYFGW